MTQNWYTSKGIWGGILMVIAFILQLTGVADITPSEQTALTDSLVNVAAVAAEVVGLILSIWGRITAKKPIGTGIPKANIMYDLGIAVFLILMSVGYAMGFVNHHHADKIEPSAGVIDMHLVDGIYSAPHAALDPAELPEL